MAGHALRFAREVGAEVVFFFATAKLGEDFYGGEATLIDQASPEEVAAQVKQEAARVLSELEALASAQGVTYVSRTMGHDHPFEAIIQTAESEGCDLIFMASHGRRGIKALILGSETQRVLSHSKIPVLVYR